MVLDFGLLPDAVVSRPRRPHYPTFPDLSAAHRSLQRVHKRSALYKALRQQPALTQKHRCRVLPILLTQIQSQTLDTLSGAKLGFLVVFTTTIAGIQNLKAFAAAKVAEVNRSIVSDDLKKTEHLKRAEIARKLEYDRHIEEAIKAARAKRQEDAKKLAQAEKAKKAEMAKQARLSKKSGAAAPSTPSKSRGGGGKKDKKELSKSAECISVDSSSDDEKPGPSRRRRGPCFSVLKSCLKSDMKESFSRLKFSSVMESYFSDRFKVLIRRRYSSEML